MEKKCTGILISTILIIQKMLIQIKTNQILYKKNTNNVQRCTNKQFTKKLKKKISTVEYLDEILIGKK